MKPVYLLLLAVLSISFAHSVPAKADVAIDSINFPDANFRAYVLTLAGGADSVFTDAEIQGITYIGCVGRGISDLTGIQHFTALSKLYCFDNPLFTLDVSKNTALTTLYGGRDSLTSLDVSHNTLLEILHCDESKLTSLDISHNTTILDLSCGHNRLTNIDISQDTALCIVNCSYNEITSLDFSHAKKLSYVNCMSNNITSLDFSHNPLLDLVYCNDNHISSIDFSENPLISTFYGYSNSRSIKVYSYDSNKDGTPDGYFVPLASFSGYDDIATIIDNAGNGENSNFDVSRVVSWSGATANAVTIVLDTTQTNFSYVYNTGCPDTQHKMDRWYAKENWVESVPFPNAYFTLNWSPEDIATDVDGIVSADVHVFATQGSIHVAGDFTGNVMVINLAGQQVYNGSDSEIAVPAGVYVVNVNGKAYKVLVR